MRFRKLFCHGVHFTTMGFTVYYQTTRPVDEAVAKQIEARTNQLCEGKSWLSCEPVLFFQRNQSDGLVAGGSKPNFDPDTNDIREANQNGLPDGTIRDVVEILTMLSSEFQLDWNFAHDHDPGPVGTIQNGVADRDLMVLLESFAQVTDFFNRPVAPTPVPKDPNGENDNNGGDGPNILKFPGV